MRSEPESFRARTLSASLTVKDLAKSLAWYHDVVGFSVEREHRREGTLRAISLSAGDVRILINLDDGAKGWDRAKGEGFSLQMTTDQNVDEMAQRNQYYADVAASIQKVTEEVVLNMARALYQRTGLRALMFRLRDPDGFKLTISSARASS